MVQSSDVKSRLFACEPVGQDLMVEVYERHGAEALLYQWHIAESSSAETTSAESTSIDELLAAVAASDLGDLGSISVDGAEMTLNGESVPPTFLVCTQGSHDTCCGTSGVALADEIEAERPGFVVRRVSHTGGHRFSPTFLAFPEGRMWAFADLDLVDRIANNEVTAQDLTAHARGWWGAPVGAAQVAESAVRCEQVGGPFVEPEIVAVETADPDAPKRFRVHVQERSWQIDVQVARMFPSISCESPGGLPVKPGREFSWTIAPQQT